VNIDKVLEKYVIDVNRSEFKGFPETVNGDVFLEWVKIGNATGVITVPVEALKNILENASEETLVNSGYKKYVDRWRDEGLVE